jgi:MFS family permease
MARESEIPPPAAVPPATPGVRPRPGLPSLKTFDAIKNPAFRWLWFHTISYALVQGMQRFAFVWLVLDISDRDAAAGIVAFCLGAPIFVFTLPAGVLADRVDRRLLLFGSQGAAVVIVALTAILIWTGVATIWVAYALALGIGATIAVGQPVRQAILPSLVDRATLMNAIVLNTLGMNITFIVGPALGGGAIALLGIGGGFALQAGILVVGFILLIPLRIPPHAPVAEPRKPLADLRDGIGFVIGNRNIALLIMLLMLTGIFMMGPSTALIPQVAKEKLGQEAFAASMLFTFTGVGMLTTSLWLASQAQLKNKGAVFMGAVIAGGILIAAIGLSPYYALTAAFMFFWGAGGGFFINLNQTLVQGNTPDNYLGRVMSIHTLGFLGFAPLGSLLSGVMAASIGASEWMAVSGTILTCVAVLIFLTQGQLRRMD